MGSRGSVIPSFVNQIKNNRPITITNLKTRFMMSLDDAVDPVIHAFKEVKEIFLFKKLQHVV